MRVASLAVPCMNKQHIYLLIWTCLHKYTKCCYLYWAIFIIDRHVQNYLRHNFSHLEYFIEQNNLNQYALVMQRWWIFISSQALFCLFSMTEWEDFHSKPLNTDHLSSLWVMSCLWFPFVSLTAHTHILITKDSVYWKTITTFDWQHKYETNFKFGVKMSVTVVLSRQLSEWLAW